MNKIKFFLKYSRFLLASLIFLLGFFSGRLTTNKISKKTMVMEQAHVEVKKEQVLTSQEAKKDSTKGRQTIREKISYSSNGKIKSKETFKTDYRAQTSELLKLSVLNEINNTSLSKSTTSTTTEYMSNWIVFANYKFDKAEIPKSFEIHKSQVGVDYRMFGSSYVSCSTHFNDIIFGFAQGL